MTVSYNWLAEYLPVSIEPEKLSEILTSIGLEVESLTKYESIKGGLNGLVVGEVLSCEKHPDADKLKLTTVNVGGEKPLQIVCGAPNVTAGQKVIVATIGTRIYPTSGDPIDIKKAKIRGVESEGMICAEDEIGLSDHHGGIIILPAETIPCTKASEIFPSYEDFIYEIGLTPNRMDAMSHLGVAKDVCAYLSYHEKQSFSVKQPYPENFSADKSESGFTVSIENTSSCKRYTGILISDITVAESPQWLQQKLNAIGLRPINNIVDITNYILHETGQPLHAFDADQIKGNKVIVKNVAEGTLFRTLDDKERKLSEEDLMICNESEAMCIAGVYGGINSGVTNSTKNIFLESAYFEGGSIRKTSFRHGLRTDAASRFEKGVDISNTLNVLKRAALMIKEIVGGTIVGDVIDIYPSPAPKTSVVLTNAYLKKLSGKLYEQVDVKRILTGLGFELLAENIDELTLAVPFSKPDISIPADIVEEIMRIDGLDNIDIPSAITITPSIEKDKRKFSLREKASNYLVGLGFYEIFTNSISNSGFYNEDQLANSVKMMNSLSADLDILRPYMIQSGLQVIAHNINRKNNNLRLFEFGKTYAVSGQGQYTEKNHLSLYLSGNIQEKGWRSEAKRTDYYYIKGAVKNIFSLIGFNKVSFDSAAHEQLQEGTSIILQGKAVGHFGEVNAVLLKQFDIKHPVYYADIDWDLVLAQKETLVQYKEIPKFPFVNRDLALVVDKNVSYSQIEQIALSRKIGQLTSVALFDIFESEKLGKDKKSMALSFTFLDESKTLTDAEIDGFMQKIISGFEKDVQAEIRK